MTVNIKFSSYDDRADSVGEGRGEESKDNLTGGGEDHLS